MLMDLGLETSCPVVGAPSRASDLEQDLCLESSMPVALASSRRVDGVSCLGNLLQEGGLESGSSTCVAQAAFFASSALYIFLFLFLFFFFFFVRRRPLALPLVRRTTQENETNEPGTKTTAQKNQMTKG